MYTFMFVKYPIYIGRDIKTLQREFNIDINFRAQERNKTKSFKMQAQYLRVRLSRLHDIPMCHGTYIWQRIHAQLL